MKTIIETVEEFFEDLHNRSEKTVGLFPYKMLFTKHSRVDLSSSQSSAGELILRSAAAVEQAFGGLTTSLWDDPFEWTLPEELSTKEKVLEYLTEVRIARINGFRFFESDKVLYKEIPAPEELKTIAKVLIETLARAENFYGQAISLIQFGDIKE